MATAVITTSSLTGPRKAAIALLSLDEELASQVLSKMSLGDVKRLCEAVEDLGDVGGELIQLVLNDLERGLSDPLAMARASGPAYLRKLAERRGARDAQLDDYRWWLEELRVGLFAQELKTPQPVSVKRLEKIWAQTFT